MKKLSTFLAAIALATSLASAQAIPPLDIFSSFPVSNVGSPLELFGQPLTNPNAPMYNPDAPRVELHGIIGPLVIVKPTAEGLSNTNRNPLLGVTSIGNASSVDGVFSYTIPHEYLTNCISYTNSGTYSGFFFRAYDQSTVEASHYYADSSIVQYTDINKAEKTSATVSFSKNLQPFPGTEPDSDGDGLSDAEENEYGTDPTKGDTDNDGIDDATEIAYGLDPLNPIIIALTSQPVEGVASDMPEGKNWYASWPVSTNPKVRYTLEFVPDLLDLEDGTFVHPAAAQHVTMRSTAAAGRSPTDTNWSEVVNDWVRTNSIGFMRVLMSIDTNAVTTTDTP